jgi:acyl-CoA synthetase (NDP forming)
MTTLNLGVLLFNNMPKLLQSLFYPKSIALIGVSQNPQKIGYQIATNILTSGYKGQLFLLNPKMNEFLSQKAYPDFTKIPQIPQVTIMAIPAPLILSEMKSLANKKLQFKDDSEIFAIIISAGFGEMGMEGKQLEEELLKVARDNKIHIVGPNCLGVINNDSSSDYRYNGSFAFNPELSGNISLISQSGSIITGLVDKAASQGFGFNKIISVGNKIDLEIADYINYLQDDPQTEVIAIYNEGYKNGQDLAATIAKTKKPVIILKSGQSDQAKKAVSSHTGSIAGDGKVARMYLQKANSVQVQNLEEFFNCLVLFQKYQEMEV